MPVGPIVVFNSNPLVMASMDLLPALGHDFHDGPVRVTAIDRLRLSRRGDSWAHDGGLGLATGSLDDTLATAGLATTLAEARSAGLCLPHGGHPRRGGSTSAQQLRHPLVSSAANCTLAGGTALALDRRRGAPVGCRRTGRRIPVVPAARLGTVRKNHLPAKFFCLPALARHGLQLFPMPRSQPSHCLVVDVVAPRRLRVRVSSRQLHDRRYLNAVGLDVVHARAESRSERFGRWRRLVSPSDCTGHQPEATHRRLGTSVARGDLAFCSDVSKIRMAPGTGLDLASQLRRFARRFRRVDGADHRLEYPAGWQLDGLPDG